MIDTVSNMLMEQFAQTSGCLNNRKYQEVFLWWIKLTFELKFNILNTFPISWCQWATMTMTFFFISLYFFAFYILYFKTIWRRVPSSYGCHLFNDFFVLFLEEYAIPQYSYMAIWLYGGGTAELNGRAFLSSRIYFRIKFYQTKFCYLWTKSGCEQRNSFAIAQLQFYCRPFNF